MLYSPQLALKLALTEWLGEFCVPRQYNSKSSIILSQFSMLASAKEVIFGSLIVLRQHYQSPVQLKITAVRLNSFF